MKTTTRPGGAPNLLLDAEELLGERAAQLGAGEDARHVELDDHARRALAEQALGHALHDGRLADARLADEKGIVGSPLAEDVEGLLHLALAPDEGVELPGSRERAQVAAELGEPREVGGVEGVGEGAGRRAPGSGGEPRSAVAGRAAAARGRGRRGRQRRGPAPGPASSGTGVGQRAAPAERGAARAGRPRGRRVAGCGTWRSRRGMPAVK